ncbi:hypothetical protein RIF29_40761 [Crotalaria pallida]|uniref:Uncharacterized protein n=1 Tax=Crotalaria pallida TaxID=3830 RepID=A0AAN9E634_CROPI
MDTTKRLNQEPLPPSSPNRTSDCNSPEFEFWMLRNPSFPQPNLLSADELFVDGVLLPLHLLSSATNKPDQSGPEPVLEPEPDSSPAISNSSTSATSSASKRWKDIFRKTEKKNAENNNNTTEEKGKKKKKEKRSGSGSGASSSAELNINIWPFSRSRSAGNSGTRPKFFAGAPATRKVNSAPCSRSNSAGESKSRKWPSSPGRAGLHVGRSSPVWQVRRGSTAAAVKNSEPQAALNAEKVSKKRETATSRRSKGAPSGGGGGSARARVLNLNVPMCVGYRQQLSCRSDDNGVAGVSTTTTTNSGSDGGGNSNNDSSSGGNLFNLRSLFTKKSIVTSY